MNIGAIAIHPSYTPSFALETHIKSGEKESNLIVDNVKISPGRMVFKNAYDGKIFNSSFSIMNCGKYPAFVRVMPPGSKIFQMKPVTKGITLSAGLRLTIKMCYTHKSAMVLPNAYLFIYVNEKPVIYKIEVHLSCPLVSISPSILDFGELDVGNSSKQMSVKLTNSGHKLAAFSVDLGRRDLEIIVEPMKGTIEPNKSIAMTVEVLGSQLGLFSKEFWIKTKPIQRVQIKGIFISARLVLDYPFSKFNLKMIDFPKTYYGAKSKRVVVMRNNSSTTSMFCTVAERMGQYDHLTKERKTNPDLHFFFVNPREGRLQIQEKYVLRYSFEPRKMKNFPKKYCIAIIKILKINYRDGFIVAKDVEVKTFPTILDIEEYSVSALQSVHDFFVDSTPTTSCIRICLYGEMEEASVKLTPVAFYLSSIKLHQNHECILNIKNNSEHLPIIVKYVKAKCIEVEPKEVYIGPNCNVNIRLIIRPTILGDVCIKVKFNLIYRNEQDDEEYNVGSTSLSVQYFASAAIPKREPKFNMGITPMLTNEVGNFVDDIRFNTSVNLPRQAIVSRDLKCFNKNNDALIAFPNDRPKSLRPWKNTVPTRTIFANIPRIVTDTDEYVLNAAELEAKQVTKSVYSVYIKSLAKARQTKLLTQQRIPDYNISGEEHLLLEKFVSRKQVKRESMCNFNMHLPLPPELLMSVIISPKYVRLGEIAPYTSCTNSFTIENKNDFTITVSIKALSKSVVIQEKKRMNIEAKKIKNIFFDCFSYGLGKYCVPVFIIVNNYHIFDATVFAKVVPTTVKCNLDDIVIDQKTNEYLFKISNPVNCNITFSWEVQDNNFIIHPKSGIIPSRRDLYCRIIFIPQNKAILKTEIYLLSQSGAKQIITVSVKNPQTPIEFDTRLIQFNDMPLNTPISKKFTLRNFSDVTITYLIKNSSPLKEITIKPTEGEIYAKSDQRFLITAHFKKVVDFNCQIDILIQDVNQYVVYVEGSVVFPSIQLEPYYIQIPKITSWAYIRRVFRVTNTSTIRTRVHFPLEDIPEFFITDMDKNYINKVISLEPNESMELFLEFKPTEPVAYSIFLPYIINDIIGPPALNDPTSLNPKNYFAVKETDSDFVLKKSIDLPETLSTISIRCAARAPWLKFSSLYLHLYNNREKYFTIKNISVVQQNITIPMADPKCPFTFKLERAGKYKVKDGLYKITIELEETVTFKLQFNPETYGYYNIELPIFVEKYFEKCPFNYIKISGSYPKPIISCSEHVLCFYSIWVSEKASEKIVLDLITHAEHCRIITRIANDSLSIRLLEKMKLTNYKSRNVYRVTFDPTEECVVDHDIIFSCTCCSDSTCTLTVKACADESIFVSYYSLFKSQALNDSKVFTSTYPYFPDVSNNSFYASKMKILLRVLERWIFTQGFFCKTYFKIPTNISCFPVDIQQTFKGKKYYKKPELLLPLMQLLVNLVDKSILNLIYDQKVTPHFENLEGTVYAYSIYRNTISFLKSQGIFVPQLKSEYLLPYDNYVMFREHLVEENDGYLEKTFSEHEFHLFSKQCWVDLLLKIYKVFVFNRIVNPTPIISKGRSRSPVKPHVYQEEFAQYYSEHYKEIQDHCDISAKLLLWLEFHYAKQKLVLWDSEKIKQPRKIRSFNNDLWDSLTFATLMLSYCPYMIKDLTNFYCDVQNDEQIFHNACLIFESWKKINLSFDLSPCNIVKPITNEMVFLVCYLYDVLPNFYPTETLTLEAPLGELAMNEVVLKNHGNVTISYTAILFLNDSNIFQVESKTIQIPPKLEKKIKITYLAKDVTTRTAVLVLSGETPGYNYSKSIAVTLVGTPSIFKFSDEFEINVDTYERVRRKLKISSPYEKPYTAKVFVHVGDESQFVSVDQFIPMSKLELAPIQINVDPVVTFDEEGDATMKISLCYLITGCFTYFIYFVNDEIGDFCIKITILSVLNPEETIDADVILPSHFDPYGPCTCQNCSCVRGEMKLNCPKKFTIEIPCRNSQLFEGLRSMLEYFCNEDEYNFWKGLLDYPKGLHVLRHYIRNTFDKNVIKYQNALKPIVTYDVKFSPRISGPATVTLENVSTDEKYGLSLHWNGKGVPVEETLVLTALHGQEKRQYKLSFIPKGIYENEELLDQLNIDN